EPAELESWRALPLTEAQLAETMGIAELVGEPGYSALERRWARPTLDVHGVVGGFTGPGQKTVIPARAKGKGSMRRAPGQRPERAREGLRQAVPALAMPGTRAEVVSLGSAPPVRMAADHPGVPALGRAFTAAFDAPPLLIREGGSVPVVLDFQE